jgi:hypothetical protein
MAPTPSSSHRLTLIVAVVLVMAGLLPVAARGAVPVGLYPLQAEGLTEGERSEVQAIVEAALQASEPRGVLEPRSPLVLPGSCKAPITVGCVATLAKGGVVLYAKAKRRGAQIQVTVLFVDAAGRRTRAAAFPLDLFIQNLRPANDALASVEADLVAGNLEDPTPPPAPARPRTAAGEPPAPARGEGPQAPEAPPKTPAVAEGAHERAEEPPRASAPIDLTPVPKTEPARPARVPVAKDFPRGPKGRDWRLTAGRWATGGGLAMITAGAVFGLTGKRLSDALQDRFDRGALRPEDEHLFDRVDSYARLANILFVAGGAATAAGLTFQVMAPSGGGAGVAMAGTF